MTNILTGPIKVGQKFIWEPLRPHARCEVEVVKVTPENSRHEAKIWTSDKVWNCESRFREACVRVGPDPDKTDQSYTFRVGFNARCYGDVTIKAETYAEACAQLNYDNIGELYVQTDDIDTSEISDVHLFGWQDAKGSEGGCLGVDLPKKSAILEFTPAQVRQLLAEAIKRKTGATVHAGELFIGEVGADEEVNVHVRAVNRNLPHSVIPE